MKDTPAIVLSGLAVALAFLLLTAGAHAQSAGAPAGGANAALGSGGFTLGAAFTQGYDSNATLTATPESDTDSRLSLNLGGQWSGPRWNFAAEYAPEAVAYERHTSLSYVSQGYQQSLTYLSGPHTQLNWTATAAMYPQRGGMPGTGFSGLVGAGYAAQGLGAASDLTTGGTGLSVEQQTSLRSHWTANFQASWSSFSLDRQLLAARGAGSGLGPATHALTYGGGAGWSYRLGPTRTLTLSAGDNIIHYTGSGPRVQYSVAAAQLSQQIAGTWTLRVGGGPAWTQNQNSINLPFRQGWGYNANAGLVKQFGRSESGLEWSHGLQASYLPGGVATDMAALQYATQWAVNWHGSVQAGYTRQSSATLNQEASLTTAFASGSLSWQWTPDWWLQAQGSFYAQPLSYLGGGPGNLHRVVLALGIQFQPRGRQ